MSEPSHGADGPIFGPKLEELLAEMASDPRSTLLRVPRSKRAKDLLERRVVAWDAVSAQTRAEAELLRVHREELSLVLRQMCLRMFYASPDRNRFLHHSKSVDQSILIPTREAWEARAARALERSRLESPPLPHLELLQACMNEPTGSELSIVRLARAAQILAPSDIAECYEGLALVLEGQHAVGARVLASLVSSAARSTVLTHAEENIGLAMGLSGDDRAALLHYRRSWELAPDRPVPVMAWLVCALTTHQPVEAERAGAVLDELVKVDHPAVLEFVQLKRNQRTQGLLVPEPATQTLVARTRDRVGATSEAILDVLS
jgi:hypothetical protein